MIAVLEKDLSQIADHAPAEKELALRRLMRDMGRVLVAYSGGVDSTYLALIAVQELGESARCVMGESASVSAHQRADAADSASKAGIHFESIQTLELDNPDYAANPTNRCFFCKDELYASLSNIARTDGIEFVLDGTNADDLSDHRPGRDAARDHGVRSPLAELGFTKADIRELSRRHGIVGWNKPASPCLSSRIAFGVPVTIERLSRVERAEQVMRNEGFTEFRVRLHGDIARIEVGLGEMPLMLNAELFGRLNEEFLRIGFKHATLDLGGFRSGSMNPNVPNETILTDHQKVELENV